MNKHNLKNAAVPLQDKLDYNLEILYAFNGIPWHWILLKRRYSNQQSLKLKEKHLLIVKLPSK